ncbi:uncharacterized protein [Nicotiana tomentosiformis]|uniref:uncharacterized protein n=1 Tax=Nicotiana tomentosiformis TaxID=4098 RepID=UPI00388CD3E5
MANPRLMALPIDNEAGLQDETNNLITRSERPLNDIDEARVELPGIRAEVPLDVNSHVALEANQHSEPEKSIQGGTRYVARDTHNVEEIGVSLRMIFEMLQAQQVAIAQLQSQTQLPSKPEPSKPRETSHKTEPAIVRSNEQESGTTPEIAKILEELTKRIEANDKKIEICHSRVDQIMRAPPIIKGLDSKTFVQRPFPSSAAPKPIPKIFHMPKIPKYNSTTDPNEHVTSYTYAIKGNYLEDDEIESVLFKKLGETLSKGAMICYHNMPPNSIDSFAMLVDSFVKAHTGAIKVATRKSDLFKVKQRGNEMLRKFVSRFQMERMELPPVTDDWAVQAFTQGLNEKSSIVSRRLKQNLIEYPAITWADVHNCYQSKIRVEDDQLGAPSGSMH